MIEFKMKWYKDEYGNKARMWEIYVDGVKDTLEICHVCKKYYNEMLGNSEKFVKNSKQSYAVGGIDSWYGDVYVGDYDSLKEAKNAAVEYLRG